MESTLTTSLRFRTVKNFEDSIIQGNNQFYVFFGQPLEWQDESQPPTPVNNLAERNEVWSNIVFLKKVYQKDISLAFRNIRWSSSRTTPYDYYTDQEDLEEKDYYVINSSNQVYKCIDNNNGSLSTVEPTGTNLSIFETSDGYRWKYLFTIPDFLIRKFGSDEYVPISSDQNVINSAVKGTIDHVEIVGQSFGLGYAQEAEIPIFISGDGDQNDSAEIEITSVSPTGAIEKFQIRNRGGGYSFDTNVTQVPVRIQQRFDAGTATGDTSENFVSSYGIATIDASEGQVVDLQIVRGGQGYSANRAKIVQSSAYAYAKTDENGSLTDIVSVFRGRNFRRAEAILVENDNPTAVASVRPIVSPFFGHGGEPNRELNVRTIIFNVFSVFDENQNFSTENDFRTVGLIENPISSSTNQPALENTLDATYRLTIAENNANQYSPDDTLIGAQSESQGFVIDSLNQNTIRYIRENQTTNFQVGEQITLSQGGDILSTITNIQEPNVVPYSGEILLIYNNDQKVQRDSTQIESTTFIINF